MSGSFKIFFILMREDLWDIVELQVVQASSFSTFRGSSWGSMPGITSSTSPTLIVIQIESFWKQKHKALTKINLFIKEKIIPHVMRIQEPKDVWEVLKILFKMKNSSQWMPIRNKSTNFKMDETTSMEDFLINIKDLVNQLASFGEIIIKYVLVKMVLNVFPPSFDHFGQSISTQKDLPMFEELIGKLLHEEHRRSVKNKQRSDDETL